MNLSLVTTNSPPTLSPTSDADAPLVAAARRDPRAFDALYRRYITAIYRYAYVRLQNVQLAEDVTSQVFLKALQALPQFRDGFFAAWLFRIAHNTVADSIRRAPRTEPLDKLNEHPSRIESPPDATIRAIERDAFYRALRQLPEEQQRVLDLTLSGMTGEEIARVLGKSHASVKMARWRAIANIKERVARHFPNDNN